MTGWASPGVRTAGVLAAFAGAAALVADGVHRWTAEDIALARAAAERRAVERVAPMLAGTDWPARAQTADAGPGRRWIVVAGQGQGEDEERVRVAAPWRAEHGYNGGIDLAVALAPTGTVLRVEVIAHRETPGLGDRMERRYSDWLDQFAGRVLGETARTTWRLRRDGGDFDGLTGATVTARAVVSGVREALESAPAAAPAAAPAR